VLAVQLTAPEATHAEGPVFCADWGGLRWVDMLAGDILHLDAKTGAVERWSVGRVAAAFRPRTTGGMIIATEREFVVGDFGGPVRSVGVAFTDPAIRFNDGGCDPAGRFLCGTMAYAGTPGAGSLYRLAGEDIETVIDKVTISNGLEWTADAERVFYVDTPTGRVDQFDSDVGGGALSKAAVRHHRPGCGLAGRTGRRLAGRGVGCPVERRCSPPLFVVRNLGGRRRASGSESHGLHVRRQELGSTVHHHLP